MKQDKVKMQPRSHAYHWPGCKVTYVKAQPQTRPHTCHWPGCDKQVPPAMWGCRYHWSRLPSNLRKRIWITYKPGQEVTLTPSREYLVTAHAVQAWIREHCVGGE